ncbi:MAG TPA: tyrosine--tRNA ligase [Candidatus Poseidoniaceae archaeon]|nr:tyrosine--tRNA ligase [Candidatus Poseidoniaceae archaeon]
MGLEILQDDEISRVISIYEDNNPKINSLNDEQKRNLVNMIYSTEEVVGINHLIDRIIGEPSTLDDNVIRCYVGYEPSGKAHVGWLVQALCLRRILESGGNVLIYLADWHAWVNDKFNGDLEKIKSTGAYMEKVFKILLNNPTEGEGPGELRFLYASDLMDSGDYWARVLRCSKNMSLKKVRKTFTIMGRDEDSSDGDLSKFFYPAMQAADIFQLHIDIALGGMDQRKAHMYMRKVGDKYKWKKATCFHTPIISSLKASGARMESFDHKMSKSNPNGAILLHDSPEKLRKKMRKAYLDPSDRNSPIYELIEHIILPEFGKITVTPKPEFGEPSTYSDLESLIDAVSNGTIHPIDAKYGVADAISELLIPINYYFNKNPELLEKVESFSN